MNRPPALWENDGTTDRVIVMAIVSAGGHALLMLGIFLASFIAPKPLPPPVYQVSLIAPLLKGTPGGGQAPSAVKPPPGSATTPPPAAAATPAPAAVKAPAAEMAVPTNKSESKAEALARIQRELKLRKLAEAEAARHAKTADTPSPNPTQVAANTNAAANAQGEGNGETGKGNGGSEYGVWDGLPGSATYEQQVQAIVQRNWDPFVAGLSEKNPLQCMIRVVIGFDGKISSKQIESSSSNASFDNSAMAALIKSDPLPPPPLELKAYLAHKGIPLRFDSRTKLANR